MFKRSLKHVFPGGSLGQQQILLFALRGRSAGMPTAGHECSFSELMNPAPFQQLTLKLKAANHVKSKECQE